MSLVFDGAAGRHDYFLEDARVPSVTQVLRDTGLVNFDGVPPFILEAARQRGTAVHALVHYLNENDLDWASVDEAYRGYLEAWQTCCAALRVAPRLCEYRVASRRHRVAGTIDTLCTIAGDGWILDFATGDPYQCAKSLQTAAYLGLAYEWAHEDARLAGVLGAYGRWRRGSVRLRKDGSYRLTEYTNPQDYEHVQVLTAAWHIRADYAGPISSDDLAA